MELTRSLVRTKAKEYTERQPLAAVEEEHIEILPAMLTERDYGWRDIEWVVQWYFRRHLGAYPDERRRAVEAAFNDNSFEETLEVLSAVTDTEHLETKLEHLQRLDGVDTEVASAFLFFMYPKKHIVIGERGWTALYEAGYLNEPYPDSPSIEEYLTYQELCEELRSEFDTEMWTLYRALWCLGGD